MKESYRAFFVASDGEQRPVWSVEPENWTFSDKRQLSFAAARGTDLFYVPGIREIDTAVALLLSQAGSFTLRARVQVSGRKFADAGGLLLRGDAGQWLKVCVELDRRERWSLVTIATAPISDETRGPFLTDGAAWLLLSREETRLLVLYSLDGVRWEFARTLHMSLPFSVNVGVFGQAPFSDGCQLKFSDVEIAATPTPDRR